MIMLNNCGERVATPGTKGSSNFIDNNGNPLPGVEAFCCGVENTQQNTTNTAVNTAINTAIMNKLKGRD